MSHVFVPDVESYALFKASAAAAVSLTVLCLFDKAGALMAAVPPDPGNSFFNI